MLFANWLKRSSASLAPVKSRPHLASSPRESPKLGLCWTLLMLYHLSCLKSFRVFGGLLKIVLGTDSTLSYKIQDSCLVRRVAANGRLCFSCELQGINRQPMIDTIYWFESKRAPASKRFVKWKLIIGPSGSSPNLFLSWTFVQLLCDLLEGNLPVKPQRFTKPLKIGSCGDILRYSSIFFDILWAESRLLCAFGFYKTHTLKVISWESADRAIR